MPSFTKPGSIMRKANMTISLLLAGFSAFYYFLITRLPDRNLPNTLGRFRSPHSCSLSFCADRYHVPPEFLFKKNRGR